MEERPPVHWEQPLKTPGLGVGGLLSGARRVYRRAFASFLAFSLLQMVVQSVLFVPTFLLIADSFTKAFGVLARISYEPGMSRAEILAVQQRMQDELQTAMVPEPSLLVATAIASSLSLAFTLVGFAVLTNVALAVVDGGDRSIGNALVGVARRAESLVLPAMLIGLAVLLVGLPFGLAQGRILAASPTDSTRIAALAGAFALVFDIAVIYLGLRWSLTIPAILSEDIGFRAGLSRSSQLTRGIKVRLFLALLALSLLFALVEVFVLLGAVIVGGADRSIVTGVVTGLVGLGLLIALFVPLVPCLTVVAYRDRIEASALSGPSD